MAVTGDLMDSYNVIGGREDLEDKIYMVDPVKTPFMSMIPKTKGTAVNHEWQTDSLAAAAQNKVVEGNEVALDAPTVTVRLTNVCQLSDKTPGVSTTTEAIRKAGRKSEMGHQIAKSAFELKRDMEFDLLSNNAKATAADATAPVSAGILTWIATNEDTVGAAPAGTGADTRTSGANRAFTEAQLKTVLQKTWTSGGDPDCIIMNGFNKQVMSGFTGNATRFKSAEDRKLMASIDRQAA